MASYTIEDIELIRKKSGISYQEAVALLDYHNGNVARALIDLERNGRLHPEKAAQSTGKSTEGKASHHNKGGFANFMTRLYQFRLKVRKGDITILNLSLLFSILALLISPHLVIIGLILMLILGYRISFDKRDEDFASDNLEKMVRNAAQNVKESVGGIAREFTGDSADDDKADAKSDAADAKTAQSDTRSYYQSNPAATTYHASYGGSAPTLQVPVQVESQDGSVKVDPEDDGYNNATIE